VLGKYLSQYSEGNITVPSIIQILIELKAKSEYFIDSEIKGFVPVSLRHERFHVRSFWL
jgi:hypothetical protein